MPSWLRRMLEEGAKVTIYTQISPNGTVVRVEAVANETPDLIQVLAGLSYQDPTVDHAFYCSPEVHHIAKMPKEGGFCGYRNIQMMISYIREARAPGHNHFPGKTPSILRLQDMIEHAWEMGFNSAGKIETGGIRLTRKYIGTPEAQALFNSLAIPYVTHHQFFIKVLTY
jgi:zinc finger-containing ubiquitin peptidase 1